MGYNISLLVVFCKYLLCACTTFSAFLGIIFEIHILCILGDIDNSFFYQGVGNTLKRHYETYLLEYELSHDDVDGECCLMCHRSLSLFSGLYIYYNAGVVKFCLIDYYLPFMLGATVAQQVTG